MARSMAPGVPGLLGMVVAAVCASAFAQTATRPVQAPVAPDYGSGLSSGQLSDANFNTPESDGRPGVKFFAYGAAAFRKGDYAHAIDMYKVAASWAYKPAEYNLGIMYFKGQGVPENRPLGAAWMILAAQRGEPDYVKARDLMVTALTNAQFAETDRLWGRLRKTYGDKVALPRAKAQWRWAMTQETGSHLGGTTGELAVGVPGGEASPSPVDANGKPLRMTTTGNSLLSGGRMAGALAYRQFHESDDPYASVFLNARKGTATVGPLEKIVPTSKGPAAPAAALPGTSQKTGAVPPPSSSPVND